MKQVVLFLSLLTIGIMSCKQGANDPVDSSAVPSDMKSLYGEIMAVHDAVMPQLSTVAALQTELGTKLDQLRREEPMNSDLMRETNRVLGSLNRADNAMSSWMEEFSAFDTIEEDRKQDFLEFNNTEINDIREMINSSIKDAQAFLEQNPLQNDESI